ncbi:Rv0909 family putative TA system antitoxin [Corynebacterium pacaense]|uniref:Rv0909 family putative TA system antitoxin n=1 Tax=Corynebacterium pacaense TaxID=1816684 RepID=UPI0009BA3DFA|nr:Rv0909 family putative TA system antitoxin [Corynebacterium pacaense]
MGVFDDAKAKATEFLNSDQAEQKSDEILDKVSEFAKDKLGADKAGQIDAVRDKLDEQIGKNN